MSHEYTHQLLREIQRGHIITLEEFKRAECEAPVLRRQLEQPEVFNLLDEALGRIGLLEAELARDKGNRKHIWRQGYSAGKTDQRSEGKTVTMNPYWRDEK